MIFHSAKIPDALQHLKTVLFLNQKVPVAYHTQYGLQVMGLAYMRGWYFTDSFWASHICVAGILLTQFGPRICARWVANVLNFNKKLVACGWHKQFIFNFFDPSFISLRDYIFCIFPGFANGFYNFKMCLCGVL